MLSSKKKRKQENEVNASSTADIAFLLLIFFLVTAQIQSDKGIFMLLPPKQDVEVEFNKRNILNILVNSNNNLMIEDELRVSTDIKRIVKGFVTNNGVLENYSESPQKAIVSIKTDRGTTYDTYLEVLDLVKESYNELRANHLGLTLSDYSKLKRQNPKDRELLEKAKKAFPMQISDANPSNTNN